MSQIKAVKDASDIVAVIGQRLQLQHAGINYKSPCPFHSEKTPSFFVSTQMQRYKCFGCGETGDVFTFLERYDGMTFTEALQQLADEAGITLESYQPTHQDQLHEELVKVLSLAKEYYHFLLTEHQAGQPARDYLKQRGVSLTTIKQFYLGAATDSWDGLLLYLHGKKKFALTLLEQAGLILKGRSGRYYDRFRSRLIFPLNNHRGQVVGFSGRVLDPTVKEAKYINSPETSLYHKSKMLFGFSELFQQIRKANQVIVVEGEFDVLSSVQAHVHNVVAIKGSALTLDHAQLIRRAASQVVLALDADSAGVKATKRALQILKTTDLDVRVLVVPDGKDPDDMARKNPTKWRELTKTSQSPYLFLIDSACATFDPTSPEGKRDIIKDLAPVLSQIELAVEQDFYIKKLATLLKVKEDLVRQDILRGGKFDRSVPKPAAAGAKPLNEPAAKIAISNRELYQLAVTLLYSLQHPKTAQLDVLFEMVANPHLKHIITIIQQERPSSFDELMNQLGEDSQQIVFDALHSPDMKLPETSEQIDAEWQQLLSAHHQLQIHQQIELIKKQLDQLDSVEHLTASEVEKQQQLLRELVTLQRSIVSAQGKSKNKAGIPR